MANIVTPEFRVSYPNVFKAKKNDLNDKMEYSLVALFKKGADLSKLKKLAHEACVKKWGADEKKWPKNLRSPFRDQGDREKTNDDTGQTFMPDGYEKGAFYLNLKSSQKPGVVDKNVQPILDESEFYAGCWAVASINAFAYSQKGNSGVSFGLQNIQKVREGEPFSARTKAEEDFAPIEGGDSDGLFS